MTTNKTPSFIRSFFPQLSTKIYGKDLIYFDNAATTLKPKMVLDTLTDYYTHRVSNIHRGTHFLSEQGTLQYEQTRSSVATFLNAKHDHEIIFTKGTTDSINLVASSCAGILLKQGDEIILSELEHHSNIVPWQLAQKRVGFKIKVIPITPQGDLDLEVYKRLLTPQTKMVSITHISNALGTINPVKDIITLAHQNDCLVHLDAAQSVAHVPIDVLDLDVDFLSFSAHKLFGPEALGVLYGKEDHLNLLPPYQGGGAMIEKVQFEQTTFNELPFKFEAGTPNISGVLAFKESFTFLQSIGFETIKSIEKDLTDYARQGLESIKDIKFIGAPLHQTSVLSFGLKKAHPSDIGMMLDKKGIAIRCGHHCCQPLMQALKIKGTARASFSIYNTKEEIDIFIKALDSIKDIL